MHCPIHSIMLFLICCFTLFTFTTCFSYQRIFTPTIKTTKDHTLKLKHIYHRASANGPIPKLFRRYDIKPDVNIMDTQDHEYPLRSTLQVVDKPAIADIIEFSASNHRWRNHFRPMYLESSIDSVPDVTHRPTVLALAQMTNNAYLDINLNETDWYDLGPTWRVNNSFGWESDGIRGYIFGNEDNSLIVISIKGTSAGLWTGGPTGERDKLNDNALFSCCCARISRAWTPVCDCYKNNEYVCENSCLQKKISDSELYYDNALDLYIEIADAYQNSTIWITGHSLGGALSSLVGQTYGVPTVTFEAPGDRLASSRLHLPQGRAVKLPIWHFGHTADPIFVGVCTGPSSSCWYGGYAMESRCHTSKVCVWDTVKDNGWRVDIRSHRIKDVIETILMKPDEFPLPECIEEQDCEDCGLWQYYDERDGPFPTITTTSTASQITSTSTTTTHSEPPDDPWKTFNDISIE